MNKIFIALLFVFALILAIVGGNQVAKGNFLLGIFCLLSGIIVLIIKWELQDRISKHDN